MAPEQRPAPKIKILFIERGWLQDNRLYFGGRSLHLTVDGPTSYENIKMNLIPFSSDYPDKNLNIPLLLVNDSLK